MSRYKRLAKYLSLAIILINFSTGVMAGQLQTELTDKQVKILSVAYEVAMDDGYHPSKLQGILMQESKAGAHKNYKIAGPAKSRYYGVSQMKLSAAREVLQTYPELGVYLKSSSSPDVIDALMNNVDFAVRATSKYLLILGKGRVTDYAIEAYNKGPGGVKRLKPKNFYYTKSVNTYANATYIQSLNRSLMNSKR